MVWNHSSGQIMHWKEYRTFCYSQDTKTIDEREKRAKLYVLIYSLFGFCLLSVWSYIAWFFHKSMVLNRWFPTDWILTRKPYKNCLWKMSCARLLWTFPENYFTNRITKTAELWWSWIRLNEIWSKWILRHKPYWSFFGHFYFHFVLWRRVNWSG